jgi:hypothetical protein
VTTATVRADPDKISSSLKEAVVDSLLNLTYARISGAGEFGRVLFGARPRSLLNSGFILPARTDVEGDEVTSPIWVSAHGCDLQIAAQESGELRLEPRFALYVRVLPTEEDVKRSDCQPSFRLKRDIALRIRHRRYELLDKRWEEVKGNYASRSKHPDWVRIAEEMRKQVHQEEGVPLDLSQVGVPDDHDLDTEAEADGIESAGVVAGVTPPAAKDEHFEPLSIPHKWLRLDLALPPLIYPAYEDGSIRGRAVDEHEVAMRAAIDKRLADWLSSDDSETGGQLWAFRRDVEVRPSQYRDWRKFLAELRAIPGKFVLPDMKPKWDIRVAPDWVDAKRLNVHIALENRSEEPKQHVNETDATLFQVSLAVVLPVAMHRPLRLERVEPSYRYNRYLDYPAMGFNSGVRQVQSQSAEVRLETTWAPRYSQPRMLAIGHTGVQLGVRKLAASDSLASIEVLPTRMREWITKLPASVSRAAGLAATDTEAIVREERKFAEDLKKWEAEAKAIDAGLTILRESKSAWTKRGPQSSVKAIPYEAWIAMNEAMADMMRERVGHDYAEWRLFQLAFILASLPAIATRLSEFQSHFREERDDAVTLLYFPTGGGKSEAFFGLLLFTLFFDRLRGKGFGVSAMLRYPLRLLTIQQAQRASRVLAKGELVRRGRGYGGSSFSIGFWVGSGGSPNRHSAIGVQDIPNITDTPADARTEENLADSKETYRNRRTTWRKLPRCPFCNGPNALRRFPNQGGTLAHVCVNEKCAANEGGYRPLPFYICDEDIYDLAPSVVLGTVDKLALIGHSSATIRRVLGMLGAAPWRNSENDRLRIPSPEELRAGPTAKRCEKLYPAYPEGRRIWVDPFPALLIQDEAHLLDESLGTFAGLFESTLDAIFAYLFPSLKEVAATTADGKRRRSKVVAASATVTEPERQLEHLYQRHSPAIQFPHPGPDLYKSFYATPAPADEPERQQFTDVEVASKLGRVYVGFMTNGRPHTATSVAVLSNFHVIITELFQALAGGAPSDLERVRSLLIHALSDSPLKPFHETQLAGASASYLATLVDLHRIALTYVTNKKGGDQIMAAEAEETRKRHVAAGLPFTNLGTKLITGSVDQGEIQDVVDTAQTRPRPGEEFPRLDLSLRSVIATSAVSHGVDVEELNSMFFAGLPSDVAEYIQASSRVGRAHVGFCLLIPTPQRRRDRYVVEVFDEFHRFLERMVQPAAIDRWAERAVERVMPSLFQAYVCGVIPAEALISKAENDKAQVRPNEAIADITRVYLHQLEYLRGLLGFISVAIGLDGNFAPDGADFYRNLIERRIRHLLELLGDPGYRTGLLSGFFRNQRELMFKPMTSLRDVDEPALIHLAYKDENKKKQDAAKVKAVMEFICNGTAEMGDMTDLDT